MEHKGTRSAGRGPLGELMSEASHLSEKHQDSKMLAAVFVAIVLLVYLCPFVVVAFVAVVVVVDDDVVLLLLHLHHHLLLLLLLLVGCWLVVVVVVMVVAVVWFVFSCDSYFWMCIRFLDPQLILRCNQRFLLKSQEAVYFPVVGRDFSVVIHFRNTEKPHQQIVSPLHLHLPKAAATHLQRALSRHPPVPLGLQGARRGSCSAVLSHSQGHHQ